METELEKIINYIELNLFNGLSIKGLSKYFALAESQISFLFKSIFGITIGQYIHSRKMSVVGKELLLGKITIPCAAEKMNYKNDESFLRAYKNFFGISPSKAKEKGRLKYFNRFFVQCILSGGGEMQYETKKLPEIKLTGFKTRMTGKLWTLERFEQEHEFFECTRKQQDELYCLSRTFPQEKVIYNIIDNIDDNGFDFYIAFDCKENCPQGYKILTVPAREYISIETPKAKYPTKFLCETWSALGAFVSCKNNFPEHINNPVIQIIRWYLPDSEKRNQRYIEILI